MNITGVCALSFDKRMKSILKTEWLRGNLPTVRKGIYGGILTPDSVSIEHLRPRSSRGKNSLNNIALATKKNNNARGNAPLYTRLTQEQADSYFKQFKGIKTPEFDGDSYIRKASETVKRLLDPTKKRH